MCDPDARTEIAAELETLYRKVLTLPSDTFDTVRELDQPPGTDVGLSASSSGTMAAQDSSATDAADSQPSEQSAATSDTDEPGSLGAESTVTTDSAPGAGGPEAESEADELPASDDDATSDDGESSQTEPSTDGPDADSSLRDVAELLPNLDPPGDSEPGEVIEQLRRRQSVSLQELSRQTNIGVKFLTAIEDANIDVLPRPVYLREYLRKLSRVFEVDPDTLVAAYLERLDDRAL